MVIFIVGYACRMARNSLSLRGLGSSSTNTNSKNGDDHNSFNPRTASVTLASEALTLVDAFIFPDVDDDPSANGNSGDGERWFYGLTLVKPVEQRIGNAQGSLRRYGIIRHDVARQVAHQMYRDEYEEMLDALHHNYTDFWVEGIVALAILCTYFIVPLCISVDSLCLIQRNLQLTTITTYNYHNLQLSPRRSRQRLNVCIQIIKLDSYVSNQGWSSR